VVKDYLGEIDRSREQDAVRWNSLDDDLCMLCDAHGADKRNLYVACFYAIKEVVPEAIDLSKVPQEESGVAPDRSFYYLRVCKSCRGRFLGMLREWRATCVALRGRAKDHDGHPEEYDDPERTIPVREHGVTVMLTRAEWDERQDRP
jgi:hypothetical protein